MKITLLVVTNELSKGSFPPALFSAFDVAWAPNLEAVPKLVKKQNFDICFVQLERFRRSDMALLRQVLKSGMILDLLVAVERDSVEKVLETLGERGECLVKPYFPTELQNKLARMAAKRVLERENRFWRVELAALLADRESLSRNDIPPEIWEKAKEGKTKDEGHSFRKSRKEFEKQCLKQALERVHGNQTLAAKALGIHRNTLIWKMKRLHLKVESTLGSRKGPK